MCESRIETLRCFALTPIGSCVALIFTFSWRSLVVLALYELHGFSALRKLSICQPHIHTFLAMSFHHPFGSWSEGGQGYSSSNSPFSSGPSQPSIYGALPYVSDPAYPNMVTFFFTALNPGVLNCTVVNAQAKPVFQIVTDSQMQGYTMIKNAEGRNVSLIEWQAHPMIEIRGHVTKQYVKNWLGLTSDKRSVIGAEPGQGPCSLLSSISSRTMSVRGMSYIWAPRDKSINVSVKILK